MGETINRLSYIISIREREIRQNRKSFYGDVYKLHCDDVMVMAFVYSCCFWFSLRLGGILIALSSLLQGVAVLIACIAAQTRLNLLKEEINNLIINFNLIFAKDYLEAVKNDPQKYLTISLSLTCIYILVCILYIYGAYRCNNAMMFGYIVMELVRLIVLSSLFMVCLLVLKQNSKDIGLLIGASVACGFFLLAMFYLWLCAANLPVLINEMERDEQLATINKLQELLKNTQKERVGFDEATLDDAAVPYRYRSGWFHISRNRINFNGDKDILIGTRIPYVNR